MTPPPWRAALVQGTSAAIVAVFCYATIRLVPSLQEPYWAPIAAVVVLYPDREATRKASHPAPDRNGPRQPRRLG